MLKRKKFTRFTEPQIRFFPVVLKKDNCILIAPTGSGKTEAAMFPVFHMLLSGNYSPISVLYVTPLRALNRDMRERLLEYSKSTGISIQIKHSDMTQTERNAVIKRPPQILITTPESLQIMLKGKNLRQLLKNVRVVVADELHELSQGERGSQFSVALERLRDLSGDFQRIGLSATVGNPESLAEFLSPQNPARIVDVSMIRSRKITAYMPEKADQNVAERMGCDTQYGGSVVEIIREIEKTPGTIVFVNTRTAAEDLAFRMKMIDENLFIEVHHGSLSRESRETAERNFREGITKALISTSSLELGIDVGSAQKVVQFNSPRQVSKLLQRIGRAGHSLEKTSVGRVICNDIIELEEATAIIDLALENRPEKVVLAEGSLSTLANQIISEVNASGSILIDSLYATIGRSYCFRNMEYDRFMSVVDFLAEIRKIYRDGERIGPRRASLRYFIDNISMIPSEKIYRVIDISAKKFIGTLDERYVVNEIEPGSNFIMKGSTWRCSRIDEDRILVEPMFTPSIAPKWSGEDIPVPLEVVRRVGYNRRLREFRHAEGSSESLLMEWTSGNLSTDEKLVIESEGQEAVIQTMLGTKGNYTLASILSLLLSSATGESVEMDYSPYHIYLRSGRRLPASAYVEIIRKLPERDLAALARAACRRSTFFNSVFLYEARKFGIISGDTEIGKTRMEKIIQSYMDTPVYEDSVIKLQRDYMDIPVLQEFLSKIGSLAIVTGDRMSESSRHYIRHFSERIMPLAPTKTIIDSVRRRIMNEAVSLYCTSCGNYRTMKISQINSIRCPVCGSHMVASISARDRERLTEKGMMKDNESRRWLLRNAHLVKEKGIQAVIAMAAHGVGVETASRILSTPYFDDDEFIRSILEAEIEYARNRRFWN